MATGEGRRPPGRVVRGHRGGASGIGHRGGSHVGREKEVEGGVMWSG